MTRTQGPWKVDSSMISTGWVLVTKSNGDVVANVNTETGPDIPPLVSIKMPALTNAHLIAAAPDMLEALESMLSIISESNGISGWHLNGNIATWGEFQAVIDIEEAIRKARDEE